MVKRVVLAPKLDTAATAGLREELKSAKDEDVVFDASGVEQIGALCVELMMSAAVLWKKAGHAISLENPSDQMVDDLKRLGVSSEMLLEYQA